MRVPKESSKGADADWARLPPSFVRSIAMSLFADVDADTDTPGRSHARVSVVSQSGFMCHRIHGSAL